jgi:hypothetical protein
VSFAQLRKYDPNGIVSCNITARIGLSATYCDGAMQTAVVEVSLIEPRVS